MSRGVDNARPWSLSLALVLLGVLVLRAHAHRGDFSDLPGPYCASRYEARKCCPGRKDECKIPILGTFCYCDEFCNNRTRELSGFSADCCPDWYTHCAGEQVHSVTLRPKPPPAPGGYTNRDCRFKGRHYYQKNKFMDNCNKCECSMMDGKATVLCEKNSCLMDQDVIDCVNNHGNSIWVARNYSDFWGRTLEDGLNYKLGTINPSRSIYRMNPVRRIYNPKDLPVEFDARVKWSRDIAPIRNQDWCGASWAISAADVASDRFSIMSKGAEKVQLSAQHLVSCNNKGQKGCRGGYIERAWLFMRRFGLTDEECIPWTGSSDKCRILRRRKLSEAGCKKRNSYSLRNEMYRVGPAYRLGNETDIMQEIITSGPVQATMMVHQDFFNYGSGIYVHTPISERLPHGYHSVRIVGWGEEPSPFDGRPVKFWHVANSWGREWGEDGYFRILRGSNHCEIENYVIGVWAKTI